MNRTTTSILKSNSSRVTLSATLLAMLALILWVTPALAFAPGFGTVYEGQSVPSAALGATRAQVVKAYGQPEQCNISATSRTYTCTFKAEGGGIVTVTFVRSLLSPLPATSDKASFIRWSQEVTGWTTTAGVSTKLALQNPKAVVAAYPNAQVKVNSSGQIIQVLDGKLGIQVDWQYVPSSQGVLRHVSMAIFPATQITASGK